MTTRKTRTLALVSLAGISFVEQAIAATLELNPGQSFEAAAESLAPGDTLIVHAGTYLDAGRIAITVKGTAAAPVVIKAASGEGRPLIARRATDVAQNTINIEGATYLTLSGLEITSNGGDGVNLSGNPSFVTLDDLKIHDIAVGINLRSSMHHIMARRNEIFDTSDTGEGMYVGCHAGDCAVSDSTFEANWIHHTENSDQGDGIEIKKGSHSNIIRDNVIHDTLYPCITLYGTDGNPSNVVERNAVWNCADAGIHATADTVIRNNIIIPGSGAGFVSQDLNGVTPANLLFVNNTIIGGSPCLRLNSWSGKSGLVFANNAVYCGNGGYVIGGLSGVTAKANVFSPAPPVFATNGYIQGRAAAQDLLDPATRNAYPKADSTLIGAGDPTQQPTDDFNGTARNGSADAGGYVWSGAVNPGWTVGPGFKGGIVAPPPPAAPQVTLSANPSSVPFQGSSTLTWNASNADNCSAQGDWSGAKALSGTESTGPLTNQKTYSLRCMNSGGLEGFSSATVAVGAAPTPPSPPAPPTPPAGAQSEGGSGALNISSLALLLALTWICQTKGLVGRARATGSPRPPIASTSWDRTNTKASRSRALASCPDCRGRASD